MPIETITYRGQTTPALQASGFAARFAFPFAREFCRGRGLDVGAGKLEWAFPGAVPVDPAIPGCDWSATQLPPGTWDYIFSSNCLEHLDDPYGVLDLWGAVLRPGGVLFLYLPSYESQYWRPWHNRKHRSILEPQHLRDYLCDRGYVRVFHSGVDLNNCFTVVGERGAEWVS